MTKQPSVEFRVGASPTAHFALMLSVLFHTLKRNSGLEQFDMTVVVGAPSGQDAETAAFAEWLAPEMRCLVVDPAAFDAQGIHATADLRLQAESTADVVVCIDADMVVSGSLTDLVADTLASPAVAGVIAHMAPFQKQNWINLHTTLNMAPPDFSYQYTGWPYMWPKLRRVKGEMHAPPYFNYGLVIAPNAIFAKIAENHSACFQAVGQDFPNNMFRSQISLTLAIARAGVAHRAIGMEYNFPNDITLEALHAEALKDVRIVHLLRRNHMFDKQKTYESLAALKDFVATGWETAGTLDLARRMIAEVLPEIEARPLPALLAQPKWIW